MPNDETSIMDELRSALDREPFEPFRIVTTSGKSYDVTDPHGVAVGKLRIGLFPPPAETWFMIRSSEIVALESIQTAA